MIGRVAPQRTGVIGWAPEPHVQNGTVRPYFPEVDTRLAVRNRMSDNPLSTSSYLPQQRFRVDLAWWQTFLWTWNRVGLLQLCQHMLMMHLDHGGVEHGKWSQSERELDILVKELTPILYLLDQMAWLLFISSINFVQLLFKNGNYSRAAFFSPSQSLRWQRREWSSKEWLLGRQGNLLVIADWFTLLFWVCFTIVQDNFSCIHVLLKYSSCSLWLLLESGVYFIQ